ncbi:MAG TPA: YdeI/OmpD-associated family protein [Solirubrobacteraceae bacterium]
MEEHRGLPVISFAHAGDWERWLQEHHEGASGLWLKLAKKDAQIASVTYAQALELALCFGWIDGQKGAYDESWWLQRFTPRGPRSRWSRINREKAQELERTGRLRPAGLREIERARADGRWEAAYESQSRATVPEDLQRELDRDPAARAFFESLESHNRYAILYRLQDAKRPATRARRLQQFMEMLRAGEKLHP